MVAASHATRRAHIQSSVHPWISCNLAPSAAKRRKWPSTLEVYTWQHPSGRAASLARVRVEGEGDGERERVHEREREIKR